ncbi:MAG: lipoyl synthase [Deltaproteobacteria bacterium]|nr:lipoyl synthase [Deltaproteobacteria bacterium]
MKPSWLRAKIPSGKNFHELKGLLRESGLHTVCEEAQCPNIGECWDRRSTTILILGDTCTRSCGFCAVKTGRPLVTDWDEPRRVAESVSKLGLRHIVITSVDRDDLPDGGAEIFAQTIEKVREKDPNLILEVLIPDFKGREESLQRVFEAGPNILNHNLETVSRLQKTVRPQANYERSLFVLQKAKAFGLINKSGIMLGLGESWEEILETLKDLREQTQCDILTVGQYLPPTQKHLPIDKYYTPEQFEEIGQYAKKLGFPHVASGPFVRSSYFAEQQFDQELFQKSPFPLRERLRERG